MVVRTGIIDIRINICSDEPNVGELFMLADLAEMLSKLDKLSLEELLTLQEKVIQEVRAKALAVRNETNSMPAEQPSSQQPEVGSLNLKVLNWDNWPVDATFRREDIYDDTSR